MTPRELVIRTLEFDNPARIPRQLWLLPWAENHYPKEVSKIKADFPDDIVPPPNCLKTQPKTEGDPFKLGTFFDEWGCEFVNKHEGIIGEVKSPIVESWDDLSNVRPPSEMLSVDKDKVNSFCRESEKFILAGACPRPFERLQFLRGTENVMLDLAMKPPELKTLIDTIHQYNLKLLEVWAGTDVDALTFMDDWGAQRSLLISPNQWREIFKPMYQEYIDIAHSSGKKIFMHSDGYILDIYEDLIELGLDAINSQIFCMGLDEVSRICKGRLTFWGEVDRQRLLPEGSQDDIQNAVREIFDKLYQNGGTIAQLEFGPGAKPENVYTAYETWNNISANL
ncbi:uroporphyrinogen decarboxylase family protein [Sedimentisphaera salicampi]|uniref:Methylcobalamin:coenzyme M methyltransferase n=1 Tax=Sedimentisphaera salicampi TaxID=1941349 RepID=A0A1W6LJ49_9BACT|nr:uroporphyrinogen decarboxylase family protein [Sedimentisphaera salicampi]ARN55789.1 methylcobalamin:coenzyme M methyltransferase [Sedimentisphaera salicampi]OXU15982.1 methylcobalamin:coenzyme M methyltransferase [Sedimentisphaera salicampi]